MVKSKFYNLDTDETLASNSDYYIPSQKATKAYVDNISSTQTNTISDCILEIPQNIKMEIDSKNYVILKAGSIFVLANGSTYQTVTTTSDIRIKSITDGSGDGYYLCIPQQSNMQIWKTDSLLSVATLNDLPTPQSKKELFYVASELKYYYHGSGATTWISVDVDGYPICLLKRENNIWSFAKDSNNRDMIFNGAGFVGHHAFVYPNIKCLAPNGFNTDGTMKSLEYTTTSLMIAELRSTENALTIGGNNIIQRRGQYRVTQENDGQNGFQYIEPLNLPIFNVTYVRNETPIVLFSMSNSTTVNSFDIQQSVRLATIEMLDKVNSNVVHRTGNETIAGGKTFLNEVKMTAGGTSDISNGIVNSFKTNYAQATNFFTRNIIAGNSTSGSTVSTLPITFQKYGSITSQHPSDLSDLMRINLDGSIQTYGSYPHREGKIEGYDLTNPAVDFELGYQWIDNNGKFAGGLRYGVNSVGRKTLDLRFKKRDQNNVSIGITENADGTTYTFAPTPIRDNTSSTEIDTVGARNTKLQGYVPNTRTVNGKALSSNITLNASDVSALSSSTTINDLTTTAQQNALNSGITSSLVTQIGTNQIDISTINGKIPSAATTSNQLADKSFVNSSISTNTAYFIGTFNSVADLEAYSGTLTNNDYAFVISTDSAGNTVYNRYKYTTATNPSSWQFEYALNNSSFTSDQWAAINSGATPTNIGQIATNTGDISTLQSTKADDSAVVHLTGSESIAGEKSFTSTPKTLLTTDNDSQQWNDGYRIVDTNLDTGINPTNSKSYYWAVKDKNNRYLSYISSTYNTTGKSTTSLVARTRNTNNDGDVHDAIFIEANRDGSINTYAPTPTQDTINSKQIDTVGARNTKLANYALDSSVVKLTGDQNVSGTKTFNAEIKGTLITYQCHNGETGGFYRKMGEIVFTGSYQSAVVPFYYYKDSTNCTETGYTGKISLRVDGTAGVVGATNTGVVLGEYPDWINDGRAAFYILYKNNTPESNKATLELWTYVKNAWDGFKIIPLSYHGYSQSGWTWYNNPAGVTELPSGYTVINQKFANMYITAPTDTTTITGKQIATTGWVNTALSNKQNTLVSGTNIKTINSASVLGSGNFALADQSLSNLDSTGQMIVDSQNGTISNCILDIPQNLKLELSNGILTVKQGSVLVMSGSSTYTTITVNADKTKDFSSYQDGKIGVFANNIGALGQDGLLSRIGSGNSLPADNTTYSWFYLTTDYSIYHYESSGWVKKDASYPLCLLEKDSSGVRFAKDSNGNDMIFNGAGFIGHHVFIYPNIKVLVPNGFNADGSLKSVEVTTNSLQIIEVGTASSIRVGVILLSGSVQGVGAGYYEYDILPSTPPYNNAEYYEKFTNKSFQYYNNLYHEYSATKLYNVSSVSSSGVISITDFTIRQPVRTATVEMLNTEISSKANDSEVLHKTGIETKSGNLILTNYATYNIQGNSNYKTITSHQARNISNSYDLVGNKTTSIYDYRSYSSTEGESSTGIWIRSCNINNSENYADIRSMVTDNNKQSLIYATHNTENLNVTTVTNSTFSNMLATMGWVNNPSTSINVVHRSGNETISGAKTFSSPVTIGNSVLTYNSSTESLDFTFV